MVGASRLVSGPRNFDSFEESTKGKGESSGDQCKGNGLDRSSLLAPVSQSLVVGQFKTLVESYVWRRVHQRRDNLVEDDGGDEHDKDRPVVENATQFVGEENQGSPLLLLSLSISGRCLGQGAFQSNLFSLQARL